MTFHPNIQNVGKKPAMSFDSVGTVREKLSSIWTVETEQNGQCLVLRFFLSIGCLKYMMESCFAVFGISNGSVQAFL